MSNRIGRDLGRLREILRGRARRDLKKHINSGELIGKKGKGYISIPIPNIIQPKFRFGKGKDGSGSGVGQGEAGDGDIIGRSGDTGEGKSGAGDQPSGHIIEEFTLEELAEMLGKNMQLPDLRPKENFNLTSSEYRYSSIHTVGIKSLMARRRTFLNALLRNISIADPDFIFLTKNTDWLDNLIIEPPDFRYRVPKIYQKTTANALLIFIMDVSGSMGEEQKKIARNISFWIDIWAHKQYQGVVSRYLIHDVSAKEVDEEAFYHTRESGGTKISSAYKVLEMMTRANSGYESPYGGVCLPNNWNIYVFQFSDGDNWSDDSDDCLTLLKKILTRFNLFCYVQIKSQSGSGSFINSIYEISGEYDNLVAPDEVKSQDDVYDTIKKLLTAEV